MNIKKLLSKFFEKEYIDKYLKIRILGIQITLKTYKAKSEIIQKRLDTLYNKSKKTENESKELFYDIYKKNKSKIDYSKLIPNKPYVSAVIPVYNIGRKLLIRCLESIVNQTLQNIEIIIINDCSPLKEDDIICKEYASNDKRIKYIYNKTNMGAAASRQKGLKYASGYSVSFIDSDDYIKIDAYEMALFSMLFYNTDIAVFGINNIGTKISENYIGYFNAYDNIIKYFFNGRVYPYIYNKLYKRSLLLNINNEYIYKNMIGEDRVYSFFIFNKAESLSMLPISLYYYDNTVQQSQTYTLNKKYIHDILYLSSEIIIENNIKSYIKDINIYYALCIYGTFFKIFYKYKNIDNNKYYELINYMKDIVISILEKYDSILNISDIYDYLYYNDMLSYDLILFIEKIEIEKYNNTINMFKKKENNSVLVAELNDCHGEVIPGIVKYILDLSYKVDILITNEQKNTGILELFKYNGDIRIFAFSRKYLINIIKREDLSKYKFIFITSYYLYYTSDNWPSIKDYIKNIEKKNRKLIIMEHHLDLVNEKFLKKGKITVMHNINESKFPVYINPHYFGNIKITDKNKNITKFIIIGSIESSRKNFSLLFEGFNNLIKNGYNNFRIIVIGKGSIYSDIASLSEYIEIKGRLSYTDMYKELENADFFLPMLDNENPHHERYLKYGVSGSFQLIYGFLKPPVIHEKFAYKYGFNNDNSIIYKKNDNFFEALKTAVNMNAESYIIKQNNLNKYRNDLYNKSLINLKNIIKG